MTDFLIYDAKVAVLIIVFYMFYRLMLSRETFHRVNRVVLLLTALASFVLPLCVITLHKTVTLAVRPTVSVGDLQVAVAEEAGPALWQILLPYVYIIGVLLTLGHTLVSIMKVMLLIRRSERHPQPDGTVLCVTGNAEVSPFSWMRYIVMNREDYDAQDAAILAHERGHIRLRHSWDLLLVDLLTALQWFNPAMWMLRQDLRAIHEYEADGAVLSQGINARQYQYLLISKASGIGGYSIANGISHSTLKNRITMMLHKKSNRTSLLKLFALVPIVGVALALNANTVTHYVYGEPQKQQPVKKIEAPVKETPVEDAFDVVEQMPEYPGGPKALMDYLMKSVKYPKEAEEAQIQGRVLAQFVVDKEGAIRDAHIVKSVDPALDAEALRVINDMPNWTPGRQNGKVVNVKYTIPISFNLQGDDKEEGGNIQIRYDGTTKDPLFIVDGVKTSAEKVKAMDAKTIERMEVLKDKSAIEKYGDEAQSGVILITTKK